MLLTENRLELRVITVLVIRLEAVSRAILLIVLIILLIILVVMLLLVEAKAGSGMMVELAVGPMTVGIFSAFAIFPA